MGRVQALELGRFTIRNPVVVFSQAEAWSFASSDAQGNTGAALLRRFEVILDYARDRIILEPNRSLGDPSDYNRSSLSLTVERGGRRVRGTLALRSPI